MKGAFSGLIASAFFLAVGGANVAWAQKKIVVEKFQGSGAEKVRAAVVKAIGGMSDVEVIPEKKVLATEADLGLLSVSDSYSGVAKELKAAGFVAGSVSGNAKKMTAKITVRDADGGVVSSASFTGAGLPKLVSAVQGGFEDKLGDAVSGLSAPGGGSKASAAAEEDTFEQEGKKSSKKKEESDAEVAAKEDEEEEEEEEEEEDGPSTGGGLKYDVGVGTRILSRKFSYNRSLVGGQQEYSLTAVPAPNISLEVFPLPFVGITGGFEYAIALISEDKRTGDRFATKSFAWNVGVAGRHTLGPAELTAGVGYGTQVFRLEPLDDMGVQPQVAGVDHKAIRIGGGARVGLSDAISAIAGGQYLMLNGSSQAKDELLSKEYFPYGTGMGGEGFAGVAIALPWLKGLEARVTAEVRRYAFSMNSTDQDRIEGKRVAGGAVDQYLGGNIVVAYRP